MITWNGRKLKIKKPLILKVHLTKSGLLVATETNLGLHVFAYTYSLLIEEANEQVKESLERLTPDAQHLREP